MLLSERLDDYSYRLHWLAVKQGGTMRLFVGAPICEAAKRALEDTLTPLRNRIDWVRWVPAENWHLTLKFFGEVGDERATALRSSLSEITSDAIDAPLVGLGAFPTLRAPRVVWAGVKEPTGALQRLHAQVEHLCERHGFEPETRPFHPHITVGRARKGRSRSLTRDLRDLLSVNIGTCNITEVVLFRSELRSTGAHYSPELVVPLGSVVGDAP